MSQQPISIVINNKRRSMMSSMFLSTPPSPFSESKKNENFKLCSISQNGVYLPPSPGETYRYENWRDEDYFSFPAGYLDIPNKKHSTQAFARLEENNNKTLTELPHKAIVESPKAAVSEDNLVLQLEDTTVPPMSPSCSTSTSEESDIDDLSQENSTISYKPPPVMNKRLNRDFNSYVSDFIRHSEFNKKDSKKPESPSIFKNFF